MRAFGDLGGRRRPALGQVDKRACRRWQGRSASGDAASALVRASRLALSHARPYKVSESSPPRSPRKPANRVQCRARRCADRAAGRALARLGRGGLPWRRAPRACRRRSALIVGHADLYRCAGSSVPVDEPPDYSQSALGVVRSEDVGPVAGRPRPLPGWRRSPGDLLSNPRSCGMHPVMSSTGRGLRREILPRSVPFRLH